MAAATGQDPSKRSQFREQTWKGTKTRTRDATLSRYSGIDLNQLKVTVLGQPVELLPRELRILQFLALREGEVVSRADIEAHIYEDRTELTRRAAYSADCDWPPRRRPLAGVRYRAPYGVGHRAT